MVKKILVVMSCVFLISMTAHAKRLMHERWYQERWCAERGGVTEYTFQDRTRCDCLTATHAVEFDFADKWAEAIGQCLHYSSSSNKRAGIVLIMEKNSDIRFLERIQNVIRYNKLQIDIWLIGPAVPKHLVN